MQDVDESGWWMAQVDEQSDDAGSTDGIGGIETAG
ncbi:hypothetical protein FB390_4972 [Nocardia bhagyanarayanae]|uniref:Uncharacterized protein n=1 Tax=Nocardia bhagyanarayanae TaxID=1215925 RepID=A0A543FHK9_9NOCA|nr:hypothetical protein FB390_4972 [Nocardia bhagyanarayanae]